MKAVQCLNQQFFPLFEGVRYAEQHVIQPKLYFRQQPESLVAIDTDRRLFQERDRLIVVAAGRRPGTINPCLPADRTGKSTSTEIDAQLTSSANELLLNASSDDHQDAASVASDSIRIKMRKLEFSVEAQAMAIEKLLMEIDKILRNKDK